MKSPQKGKLKKTVDRSQVRGAFHLCGNIIENFALNWNCTTAQRAKWDGMSVYNHLSVFKNLKNF